MAANFRLVKCVLGDDIRRVRLEQPLALDALKKAIQERFQLMDSDSVTLTYKDDEDETVTVGCSDDFHEALLQFPEAKTPLKFFIKTTHKPSDQEKNAPPTKNEGLEQQPSVDPSLEDVLQQFSAAAHEAISSPGLSSVLKEFMQSVAPGVAVGAEPSESPCYPSFPHHGIVCDGCNMSPLMGPRYKSTTKQDFDLCQKCFSKTSDRDFDVRQLPFSDWQPFHALMRKEMEDEAEKLRKMQQAGPSASASRAEWSHPCPRGKSRRCHRDNWRCERPQNSSAQSRFVRDVTIWDGTQMNPSTPFTKIWTVRNDGAEPWPEGTSLAFVSGDSMSGSLVNKLSFNAPVSPGAEVEVAVDLVAPQETGRYIGYWRLSTEGGCRFGQRIWVQIQVVKPGEEAAVSVQEQEEVAFADGTEEDVASLTIGQLKTRLAKLKVDASSCIEKEELISLLRNKMSETSAATAPLAAAHQVHQAAHEAAVAEAQEAAKQASWAHEAALAEAQEAAKQAHEVAVAAATAAQQAASEEKKAAISWISSSTTQECASIQEKAAQEAVASAGAVAEEVSEAAQDKALVAEYEAAAAAQTADQAAEEEAVTVAAAEAAKEMPAVSTEEDTAVSSDGEFVDVQGALLMEGATALATMGFEDLDLNSALLEKNEGNIEQTALQLLSLTQWEQEQQDLQEMGFSDIIKNSLLLLKHAGRTTLVVRDHLQSVEK